MMIKFDVYLDVTLCNGAQLSPANMQIYVDYYHSFDVLLFVILGFVCQSWAPSAVVDSVCS